MSKRHYQALAKILSRRQAEPLCDLVRQAIAREIADYCASENQAFDRKRFLAACSVKES